MYAASPTVKAGSRMWKATTQANWSRESSKASNVHHLWERQAPW